MFYTDSTILGIPTSHCQVILQESRESEALGRVRSAKGSGHDYRVQHPDDHPGFSERNVQYLQYHAISTTRNYHHYSITISRPRSADVGKLNPIDDMDSPLLPDQLDAATMCQPLQAHPRRSWLSCWRMKSIQGTRSRLDWDNVKISVNICQQVKFEMNRWDRWDHTNWWFWYVSVVEAEEVGSNSKSMLGCLYVAQCRANVYPFGTCLQVCHVSILWLRH